MILVLLAVLLSSLSPAQDNPREFQYTENDSVYTMKRYVFCLYLSGPNRSQTAEEKARLQEAHLAHLGSLEAEGLVAAGPFADDTEKRGVLIFDLETLEETALLIERDPMVEAGRLLYECHPLWLAKGTTLR